MESRLRDPPPSAAEGGIPREGALRAATLTAWGRGAGTHRRGARETIDRGARGGRGKVPARARSATLRPGKVHWR